jgi:putative oxidoreductase
VTSSGFEYNLVLGVAALSLAFTGPGGLSADALLGYAVGGTAWGLGAGVIAVIGAAVQLAQRRVAPAAERVAAAA